MEREGVVSPPGTSVAGLCWLQDSTEVRESTQQISLLPASPANGTWLFRTVGNCLLEGSRLRAFAIFLSSHQDF